MEYSVCQPADAAEMIRLLGDVFSRRDPPAVAVGLLPAEFEAFVRLFEPRAADGLTIIARERGTGGLIGALLTEDAASAFPDGAEKLSPKFHPIFDILGQLDAEYRLGRTMIPGEALHLFLLGVDSRFSGKGFAQQLVARCLENGRQKGFRRAITEATNRTSQHVFRKMGFTDRVRRSYHDHRHEGRAFFESIAEHGGPILMDRLLD